MIERFAAFVKMALTPLQPALRKAQAAPGRPPCTVLTLRPKGILPCLRGCSAPFLTFPLPAQHGGKQGVFPSKLSGTSGFSVYKGSLGLSRVSRHRLSPGHRSFHIARFPANSKGAPQILSYPFQTKKAAQCAAIGASFTFAGASSIISIRPV